MVGDRGCGGIRVISEPAVGLLGELAGALTVAGYLECIYRPHIQPRHVNVRRPGRARGVGRGLTQFDGPLQVHRCLGIPEHSLGRPGRRHPGWQLLGGAVRGCPVPGHLRGQHLVPRGVQSAGCPLVQHQSLTRQQPGGHRLGQQRMPGPVRPITGAGGEQPGQ